MSHRKTTTTNGRLSYKPHRGWYTTYHNTKLPTKGTGTYYHEVPPRNHNHNGATTKAHPKRVKPQPISHNTQATTSGKA
ncbi:hypothetical protein Taro_010465 [Colocasia esculenta]|uniref:Uncharacterized protein n=1 Tax=Colocasia esculenta TaxID=4460 RepID=A0A843U719_COLES|nr:hypothetical protein [Colocasia esculenta]